MQTLLLTGFEPFGGDLLNPSGMIARNLDGLRLSGEIRIASRILPVSGPAAWAKLRRSIRRVQPQWIIAMGLSGREEISVESAAWNEEDYRIPDNAGRQPRESPVFRKGPFRLVSGIAAASLIAAGEGKLPVRGSDDPGRFVCNHLYYRLLHLSRRASHCAHQRCLFLHLPAIPEMRKETTASARIDFPLTEIQETVIRILRQISG